MFNSEHTFKHISLIRKDSSHIPSFLICPQNSRVEPFLYVYKHTHTHTNTFKHKHIHSIVCLSISLTLSLCLTISVCFVKFVCQEINNFFSLKEFTTLCLLIYRQLLVRVYKLLLVRGVKVWPILACRSFCLFTIYLETL